jgi:hypothetical protein
MASEYLITACNENPEGGTDEGQNVLWQDVGPDDLEDYVSRSCDECEDLSIGDTVCVWKLVRKVGVGGEKSDYSQMEAGL